MKVEEVLLSLSLVDRLKRGEVNLSLLISFWPPPGELLSYVGMKEGKVRRKDIWELISRRSKLPRSYIKFLAGLESLTPPSGYTLLKEDYRAETRIYVGAGTTGWETGINLLKPFGIPWIPGSSLKGVMEYVLSRKIVEKRGTEIVEEVKRYKEKSLKELPPELKELAVLFGTKKQRGSLMVIGGFPKGPEDSEIIVPDIISSHYKDYYEGRTAAPHEYLDPVPVIFPAIKKGTVFRFLLLTPLNYERRIRELLEEVLTYHGIGGKVNAGYGLFTKI